MSRDWGALHRHSWRKLKSVLLDWEFTSPSWMPIFICRPFWKVFSGQRNGWHPGWARREGSQEAWPRKPRRELTAGLAAGRGEKPKPAERSPWLELLQQHPTLEMAKTKITALIHTLDNA